MPIVANRDCKVMTFFKHTKATIGLFAGSKPASEFQMLRFAIFKADKGCKL